MKNEPRTFATIAIVAILGFVTGLAVHKGNVIDSPGWQIGPLMVLLLVLFLICFIVIDD